jgi:ankyrin repeat protein
MVRGRVVHQVGRLIACVVVLASAEIADAQTAPAMRAAVTKALPRIERSVATFVAHRSCVSCHHNSVAILALRAADRSGLAVDAKGLAALEAKTLDGLTRPSALDDAVQGLNSSDPTPNDTYLLMAAHAAGVAPSLTAAVHARRIASWQRSDGRWTTSDFRPPHSSSLFTATATAVRAVTLYMPPELQAQRDDVVARARDWLMRTPPASTEDAAFRLMGLVWAGASSANVEAAVRDLLRRQATDGGWPQAPAYASDAYSTGEALVALHLAGHSWGEAWRLGTRFLLAAQRRDGTWHVRTRMVSPATVSPPYFHTGFPYGKDEYISFTGSAWAVMALSMDVEGAGTAGTAPVPRATTPVFVADGAAPPEWMREALLGSTSALAARLDAGLSATSATSGGTTLLMAAAHDPEKVRLLLARGADASARSDKTVDALTVATTYFGNAASVRAFLAAGARASPPEGMRVRRRPLVWASMTGDDDAARLLIENGARPDVETVSEAITFDRPDVLARLVAAGGDVSATESTGITLLHWATITNRPSAVPILTGAGVDVDAPDERGYTALMYAASIDFGEDGVLRALLAAKAGRRPRNAAGQTALDLARRHGHRTLARALGAR